MASQIGIVKALIGTATATAADGTSRNLQVGDSVYADELVTTGAGGAVELEFADGSVMDLGRDSQALLDNAVFNPEAVAETAATVESDADAIQAAILAGADPTQVTEATAAGAGTQADGNEGHQPIVVDYLAPQVTPESGFDTTGISVEFPVVEEELQAPIEPQPEIIPEIIIDVALSRVIDSESQGVYEDETITFIATLDQTSQGNISVTLSNGAVIVISAGSLTGSVTVSAQGDDPYIDAELLSVSITGVSGGAGEGLTFNSTPLDVQIFDTIDDTTLTLNDVTVDEGTGTATIGASLSAAPTDGNVVFTLSNGATVTFTTAYVAGTTVQSTAFAVQGDDVYVDGENYNVSADSYSGGAEFENIVHTDTASVTVEDTTDTVTATLSTDTSEVSEDGGSITYTVTLTGTPGAIDPDNDLVFTLTNPDGSGTPITVTVAAGAISGQTVVNYTDEQITNQVSFDNSIASYTGGSEYEDFQTAGSTSVDVDYVPIISDLTPKLDGGDVTVDEDDLLDGSDTSKESTTQSGTFTITAEDGISSLTVGGHAVITAGVFAATSFVTAFGNTLSFTGFNPLTGEVTYEYTLEDNETHANAAGENSLFEDFTVVLLDTDLDETTGTLSVNIIDDIPTSINPTTSHLKDVATSPDVVQLLNFATGADGVGDVVFDTSLEGQAATDALGNELTFNGSGEPLYIHFSDDGMQLQFVTKDSEGNLNTLDPKFYIELSDDGLTYLVHSEGIINNGTAITATNLSSVGGGNVELKAISNLDGTLQDVVLTTAAGQTVNTNSNAIGIGTQNAIAVGEAIRFDFTNGNVTGNGGNAVYQYDGTHNLTTAFTQQINQTTAGTTSATITVAAILADADNVFFGDATGETFIEITSVKVYSGTLAQVQDGTAIDQTANVTITINGDGSATIAGLQQGWIYQIETTDDFSAVQIDVDAGNIKLGVFSYGLQSDGLPIELDYDIIGTDSDGDSVTGSLGVNLYPNGSTFEGTENGENLLGTNNADYLLGRGGDDFLFGNGGDDLLIGGYGDDEMTGGSGSDSFVFSLSANSGNDIIKDFEVGTDKLNFIDVLDLDSNSEFNLNDAINSISDGGVDGDIVISLTNGGSVTLEGIGNGLTTNAAELQSLLGATNITVDQS